MSRVWSLPPLESHVHVLEPVPVVDLVPSTLIVILCRYSVCGSPTVPLPPSSSSDKLTSLRKLSCLASAVSRRTGRAPAGRRPARGGPPGDRPRRRSPCHHTPHT